jgi:SAM-dependent methyltransferase
VACKSFFDPDRYEAVKELHHTQKTAWGAIGSGTALNDFKAKMYRAVLALLEQYCPPPAKLVDIGCGYGGFLIEAAKRGYTGLGIDMLPEAVEYVCSLGIPAERSFSIGDLRSMADGSLDAITCLDCNCYWPNQPLELKHAFTKLRPGGYLAMRVADKSWLFAWALALHKVAPRISETLMARSVNDHRFSMPVESLLHILRSRGFRVVSASPRGASHGHDTHWSVKATFSVASFVWLVTGKFLAPGALILAKKPLGQ